MQKMERNQPSEISPVPKVHELEGVIRQMINPNMMKTFTSPFGLIDKDHGAFANPVAKK